MVDKEARAELRIALRRLVTGRMTPYEFDDVHSKLWKSDDDAVAAIVDFGCNLYDDVWSDRLKGRAALGPEYRSWTSRCVLFLYTDELYHWPRTSPMSLRAGLGCLSGVLGAALAVISILGLFARDGYVICYVGPLALFFLLFWLGTCCFEKCDQRVRTIGDYACWPFLHRTDLEKTKKVVQFFGPACSTHA